MKSFKLIILISAISCANGNASANEQGMNDFYSSNNQSVTHNSSLDQQSIENQIIDFAEDTVNDYTQSIAQNASQETIDDLHAKALHSVDEATSYFQKLPQSDTSSYQPQIWEKISEWYHLLGNFEESAKTADVANDLKMSQASYNNDSLDNDSFDNYENTETLSLSDNEFDTHSTFDDDSSSGM